ncbi:transglycosylase domain-containing protein [Sphingomonas radiodurans]|uniref:transglycosylase domain-containing protein n=1 Tax=Sphingomonas radiodurans TaxID=2890321 RepID=UPI001E2A5B3F|nr:transglycosylase domain-containing protein [Sphingomonas radiodurans]WBH17739.1 transglycosylase domain-containing protein [Sphingomonas radiodurans]
MADRRNDDMRPDPFEQRPYDAGRVRYNHSAGEQPQAMPDFAAWRDDGANGGDLPPPGEPIRTRRRGIPLRWITRAIGAMLILLVIAIAWLAITAPLSQSLKPPTPPSITLTATDGTPIARRGAIIAAPVVASELPKHVTEAFLAIEDRQFYSHWGISPRGIARAAWANVGSGGVRQGGSTITQQLAKNAFLDSDRTAARKLREAMIAFWLEAWLTKDEILSRYLSNVYFGDNVYGLRAASKHYFGREPEKMNIGQAAMLAGLVKAPSRLAPTGNLEGARKRQAVVVAAMVDAGFLTKGEGEDVQPQRVLARRARGLPTGTYFADWVLPSARDQAGEIQTEASVRTTLDRDLQRTAERVIRQAGLRQAQAAIVAMKRDGEVVAMVGGRDYAKSPFNRATQARRQPGSTFKLFVYLAALRAGLTPETMVDDSRVEIAGWKPKNDDNRYLGEITMRRAFQRSSNVVAARLTQQVGVRNVIRAARDMGITTPIANEATIGLGTSEVSLLELTAAFAGVADGRYPVQPHGLRNVEDKKWYQALTDGQKKLPSRIHDDMLTLLAASIRGTGRAAALSVDAYGKTGTSQSGRDAWFIGFAGDLVVGVWIGNDDNTPNPGLHGGGIPAQIWRNFMVSALDLAPVVKAPVVEDVDPEAGIMGVIENEVAPIAGRLEGLGMELEMGPDGSISLAPRREEAPVRRRREEPLPEELFEPQ